jgi:hypothetical protein
MEQTRPEVFRIGWSVAKKPKNSTFRISRPFLPNKVSSLSHSQGAEALLIMDWIDLSVPERTLERASVFARTLE